MSSSKNFRIPYMGGKQAIAPQLVDFMLKDSPNTKYVYDLFGGGASMSFEFALRPQIKAVFYNEIDTGIYKLLRQIQTGYIPEKWKEWVSKEQFFKHKDDKTAYGGFIKTCWSFGYRGTSYIYGKNIETEKQVEHQRRLEGHKKRPNFHSEAIGGYNSLSKCLNHPNLEKIIAYNLSYENVKIITPPEETIIYLDPPYRGTGKYNNDIDHDKLYQWIKDNKYKVYLSEYNSDFLEVFKVEKRVMMRPTEKTLKN